MGRYGGMDRNRSMQFESFNRFSQALFCFIELILNHKKKKIEVKRFAKSHGTKNITCKVTCKVKKFNSLDLFCCCNLSHSLLLSKNINNNKRLKDLLM